MAERKKARHERLKNVLLEEKRRLWNELRRELFRNQEKLQTQFDTAQDIGDRSMLDVLSDTGIAVADIMRERLTRMEEVEQRLAAGTYGICEACGEEIDEERLRVMPYAIRCVACQEKHEGPSFPPEATI
ncbi:MAG: TraR/DksA C4-type zinc finger protein [Geobacteraceae bacterium]|nr:TraR/DksA C4-type zinc finger protein [Geobacteraceae bacterium]